MDHAKWSIGHKNIKMEITAALLFPPLAVSEGIKATADKRLFP
jgi:hypothetical protein